MKEAIAFFAGLIAMMIVWFCSDCLGDGAYRRGYRQAVKDANKYEEKKNRHGGN